MADGDLHVTVNHDMGDVEASREGPTSNGAKLTINGMTWDVAELTMYYKARGQVVTIDDRRQELRISPAR